MKQTNGASDTKAEIVPAPNRMAVGPWSDLALHTIGWRAFQDLCSQICEVMLHRPVEIFREAQDGGQDAVFFIPSNDPAGPPIGTVQCKHTSDAAKALRSGDLNAEIDHVRELIANGQADTYVFMTNMSVDAGVAIEIRARLRTLGVRKPHTIASFVYLASDQIINQAAKLRFMTGGQMRVPVVFRTCTYYNVGNAAQHADRPYPFFLNVPGLKIVAPSTPSDMKGLLKAAIRDDDPVLVFEDTNLWTKKELVSTDPDFLVPIGKADVKRAGTDVTIVSIAGCLPHALEAAETLAADGISAEVIDPRTLVPLDKEAILKSVAKTGRLVIADNSHRTGSVASEIAAVVVEEGFESLRKPIRRVTTPEVHIPYSPPLEAPLYPNAQRIAAAVKAFW